MPRPLPTPLLAFAIRELGCVAGVMVTASHNPPQDNGYKVYLGDGSQIVPPADAEIASRIEAVGDLADVPRGDARQGAGRGHRRPLPRHRRGAGRRRPARPADRLHAAARCGRHVGARRCWRRPGSRRRRSSSSRRSRTRTSRPSRSPTRRSRARWTWPWRWRPITTSTSSSPTTRTPTGAPPPCRASTAGGCCAATRSARCSATTCCTRARRAPTPARSSPPRCSARCAAEHGQPYVETLTGFKWISRVEGLAFGYEEALGYCVDPEHVKDKDGVSALLLLCEIAAEQKARGPDPHGRARPHRRAPRPARDRPALGSGRRPLPHRRRDDAAAGQRPRPPSAASRSRASTTSPSARPSCRRPTACGTASPRARGSSSARAAPSRS